MPVTKKELQVLLDNNDISLADIDVSKITDMSYLNKILIKMLMV